MADPERPAGRFQTQSRTRLTSQQRLMVYKANLFFQDREHLQTLLDLLVTKSEISMRTLEWFVINYSRRHRTSYRVSDNGHKYRFVVYDEYRKQMDAYGKDHFDPFCRKHKVACTYIDDEEEYQIPTSVGQLNYLYWIRRYGVLIYLRRHLEEVVAEMRSILPEPEVTTPSRTRSWVEASSLVREENIPHLDLTDPTPQTRSKRARPRPEEVAECSCTPEQPDIF